ncbi:MAG: AMP-binding protein [Janthinobacterium lividum]
MDSEPYEVVDLTIPKVLARQVARLGEKTFITEMETQRSLSYTGIDQLSNRVANALSARGATHGTHIVVFMGNSIEHLSTFFAIGKLGAVSVPINTAARGDLLKYFLLQSDAEIAIVDAALAERLAEVADQAPLLKHVIVLGEEAGTRALRFGAARQVADFQTLVDAASETALSAEVNCWDLLLFAYTSGTTGPSKGCMVSHAAALTYGTGSIEAHGYREDDVFYTCLPLFHNNALLAAVGAALLCGGSVAMSRRFSVSRYWDDVRASGATITNLLGSMSNFLWSQPPQENDADNSLRLVSMSPTPRYAQKFEQRFGLHAMSNYGLSDFGMATAFTLNDPREKLGAMGRARRGVSIRVVDDHDFPLPPRQVGEIVLRQEDPWRATTGYYKMPEATLKSNQNLWFHTGDRGYFDEDGYLYFADRKKDSIRRRGENVSAFEVEQVIGSHESVAESAVFPVSTDTNDEEVGAVVVLKPGFSLSEKELMDHCQRNLAYFMIPRYVQFRVELPMTVNQKVEKFKLKKDFEAGELDIWDREKAGIVLVR